MDNRYTTTEFDKMTPLDRTRYQLDLIERHATDEVLKTGKQMASLLRGYAETLDSLLTKRSALSVVQQLEFVRHSMEQALTRLDIEKEAISSARLADMMITKMMEDKND